MESGPLRDTAVVNELREKFVAAELYFFGAPKHQDQKKNFALFKQLFGNSDKAAPQLAVVTSDHKLLYAWGYTGDADTLLEQIREGYARWQASPSK